MPRLIHILTLVLLAAWLSPPPPAHAGAWPRGKGNGFLMGSSRVAASDPRGPYALYSGTYLEYGLSDRLTLGLDLGHGVSGKSKAVAFLRYPLKQTETGHVFAIELGVGIIADQPSLRPGLSYGRGFSNRLGSGWFAIDTVAELSLTTRRTDFKADITFGLNHGTRFKSIVQLQTGLSQGDPSFIRLAPSFVIRSGKRSHVELGMTAGLVGDDQVGVKLGFWRDF